MGLGFAFFKFWKAAGGFKWQYQVGLRPPQLYQWKIYQSRFIGIIPVRSHHQTSALVTYGCLCVMSHVILKSVSALLLFRGKCSTVYLQKKNFSEYHIKKIIIVILTVTCVITMQISSHLINTGLSKSLGFPTIFTPRPGPSIVFVGISQRLDLVGCIPQ